jgi:hypothetical protein
MIKILNDIDIAPLLTFYNENATNFVWTEFNSASKQVGLQYKQGDDVWTSAVGKSKGDELSYAELNPFFKNSPFEEVIDRYKLKRSRLMMMGPKSCYSMHRDDTHRIHVPLITNDQCFFVFKRSIPRHISLGKVTWVDTTEEHTAVNGSDFWRLHLVGIV